MSGQFQKLEKQKYHTVGTVPKSRKIKIPHCRDSSKIESQNRINRNTIPDTPNTPIHDLSLSCLDTGTSITCGGVKLVIWAQTFPLSEMMRACKCYPPVNPHM
jgi:hypothetical protein